MKKLLVLAAIASSILAQSVFELSVPNMNCGGCAKKIEDAAMSVKGVKSISFDLKSKDVNITAEKGTNMMEVIKAIQAKKYKVGIKQ